MTQIGRLAMGVALLSFSACAGRSVGSGISPTEAARACTFSAACGSGGGGGCGDSTIATVATGGGGITDPTQIPRVLSCTASTTTGCVGLRTCVAGGRGPGYCMTHPGESCDGDVLVECGTAGEPPDNVDDCAARGAHCMVVTTPTGPTAGCGDGVACSVSPSAERCDGSVAVQCNSTTGQEVDLDCADIYAGGLCETRTGPEGTYTLCTPPGPSCTFDSSPRCDGNTLVTCDADHELRLDCGLLQGTCMTVAGGQTCVPTATACGDASPDRCMGNVLETCVNGNYVGTDCIALGFTSCDPMRMRCAS